MMRYARKGLSADGEGDEPGGAGATPIPALTY